MMERRQINFHVDERTHMTPDWAIVGVKVVYAYDDDGPDVGYIVYASRELDQATLATEGTLRLNDDAPELPIPPGRYTARYTATHGGLTHHLTLDMRSFVEARGGTYADALRQLFLHWTPDDTPISRWVLSQPHYLPPGVEH